MEAAEESPAALPKNSLGVECFDFPKELPCISEFFCVFSLLLACYLLPHSLSSQTHTCMKECTRPAHPPINAHHFPQIDRAKQQTNERIQQPIFNNSFALIIYACLSPFLLAHLLLLLPCFSTLLCLMKER